MYWLKVEPLFRPLHGDPRFEISLGKLVLIKSMAWPVTPLLHIRLFPSGIYVHPAGSERAGYE